MINSADGMRTVIKSSPEQRKEAVRSLWQPMAEMYSFIAGGLDLVAIHTQNFGFTHDAEKDELLGAIDIMENADAWSRVERALDTGIQTLSAANPTLDIPDLTVLLVLGDPTNKHFMNEIRGLSAFGGISGYITITIWPTDEVLGRLEGIALHELHHNVRYSPGGVVWDPQTVTVGENVVAEGLADLFAVELIGQRGFTHFVSAETRASDKVLHRVSEGLNVTGMQNFAAWVLGDSSASMLGTLPVGLPTGAGYAAGAKIVTAYLEATGQTAAKAVAAPADDILDMALPRLGLTAQTR